MKKIMVMACTAVLAMGLLTACGNKAEDGAAGSAAPEENAAETENATEESGAASADKEGGKTFTVGFDAEFPPYGYMDENGNYTGFDLELAAEVCTRNGWEFVAQPIDWDAKDMELSSGSIDCIWNGFTMQGREDAYTWSVPYVDNSQVFVVPADAGISTQADLAGKVVGVQKDSSALAALTDEENQENLDLAASFADLVEYADYNTAFMDLEMGAVDAIAMDVIVAGYQIEQRGDNDSYLILEETLASEEYGIGFKKGNEELRDKVQTTLEEMAADGTLKTISDKWFGRDVTTIGK